MSPLVFLILMGIMVLIGISLRVAAGIRHLLDFLHARLDLTDLYISVTFPEKEEIIIVFLFIEMVDALNKHMLLAYLLQRFLQQAIDFIGSYSFLIVGCCFLDWLWVVSWLFLGLRDVGGEAD